MKELPMSPPLNATRRARRRMRGFTLVEIAIALAVFALMLGGGIMIFTKQTELQREKDARLLLTTARDALIGYAQANGRLPCPATATSGGVEAPAGGGACTANPGYLPARTLGIANGADGYLHDPRAIDLPAARIRYAVTTATMTSPNAATTQNGIKNVGMGFFDLVAAPRVCSEAACSSPPQIAIAVLVAPGANARQYPNGAGADEQENYDNDFDFVSREHSGPGSPGGEFDDLLEWISPSLLANRMVAAGQLP